MPEAFVETVHERDGYRVVLSNQGERTKTAPHRLRFPNPDGVEVACGEGGCEEVTTSQTGLCQEHRGEKYADHPVDWVAELVPPGREPGNMDETLLTHLDVTRYLIDWAGDDEERFQTLDAFVIHRIAEEIPARVPDATALQEELEREGTDDAPTLHRFIERAHEAVEDTFVSDGWADSTVTVRPRDQDDDIDLPVTVAAHLYYMALLCEESNRGDAWYVYNVEPEHSLKVDIGRAGAYMPLAFYLLLRFTDAPVAAAQQAIRSGYM